MVQKVTEVARRLNHRNAKGRKFPALFLMTDSKRLKDPRPLLKKLPNGSALIIRHETRQGKINLIHKIKRLCQKHNVKLLVSDDQRLALAFRLDGVHLSENNIAKTASCGQFLKQNPNYIITSACHSAKALKDAERAKVDAVLVSPVFPTDSHPHARTLSLWGFQNLTRHTTLRTYALGGIHKKTAQRLIKSNACGFAGINGLI